MSKDTSDLRSYLLDQRDLLREHLNAINIVLRLLEEREDLFTAPILQQKPPRNDSLQGKIFQLVANFPGIDRKTLVIEMGRQGVVNRRLWQGLYVLINLRKLLKRNGDKFYTADYQIERKVQS